jgi:SagB-type dehydrogenase family enzyme
MDTFRAGQPLAWTFHRGTARWMFNTPEVATGYPLAGREHPGAPWRPLPPGVEPGMTLADAIEQRVSCRAFRDAPVTLDVVATLLRAGYGVLGRRDGGGISMVERAVPSAGGLYPLELSLLVRAIDGIPPGVHHYVPHADGLEELRPGALPAPLVSYLFMGQEWAVRAAFVVIASAVTGRSLVKYGDRGYRYLLFEAGHLMQNLNLTATALGLGAVNLGGFFDDELAGLLCLDVETEVPLYAAAIGLPSATDRMDRRAILDGLAR